jgi:hypothetical protein
MTGDGAHFHWALESGRDEMDYTIRTPDFRGDIRIYPGQAQFEAEQITRTLDIKMPPLAKCRVTQRKNHGPDIEYDEELVPLGLKIMKTHRLAWNYQGTILRAPEATTWWIPYDLDAIMLYGHVVNTVIPEDPDEAEFPPTPWADDVMIRIKSQAAPQVPAATIPAGGSPGPSAPGLQPGWKVPALGKAPAISPDAAALVGYNSTNTGLTVDDQPPDEDLQEYRGLSKKDELVHNMISWTILESFPITVGTSLPIQSPVNGELHEAQLWEELGSTDEWVIEEDHAGFVYSWLINRVVTRSTNKTLPVGMPAVVTEVVVQTRRDGSYGYILFTPEDTLASSMKEMALQVLIEYEDGFMKVGMDEAYTVRMLANEFW